MNSPLALRSRRTKAKQNEATKQLITFSLYRERFALPIQVVQKVILIDNLYGNISGSATSLTLHYDQEIPVIDIKHRIFSGEVNHNMQASTQTSGAIQLASQTLLNCHLIIVSNLQDELVGLAIDTQPFLKRVPESAFRPLSSTYLQEGNIDCVSNLVTLGAEEPPLFLLNLHQLLQA
jgi:chemotaxis signal transduction protein